MNQSDLYSRPNGRGVGVIYVSYFVLSSIGLFLLRGVLVSGDAAATATNILAHEATYRAGFELGLVGNVLYIVVSGLFYRLFAPVDRNVALIALLMSFAGCTVQIVGGIFQLAPLVLLKDAALATTFSAAQLQSATLTGFKFYNDIYNISFVLFGVFDVSIGYLILKSLFIPRAIGWMMIAGGLGALTYLWPPLATSISAIVLALGGLAELALLIWLLVKGSSLREQAVS